MHPTVQGREGASKIRTGHDPENMAALRGQGSSPGRGRGDGAAQLVQW
ncbi:hypothetical protein ABZ845_12040 [Streptomyces sp. NPDC047022]